MLEAKAKDQKKSEAKDSVSEDRPSRGPGQECSRPRTQPLVFSKKNKKKTSLIKFGNLQFIGVARIFDWEA